MHGPHNRIEQGTELHGTLSLLSVILVEGLVVGDIASTDRVVIGPLGTCKGTISNCY